MSVRIGGGEVPGDPAYIIAAVLVVRLCDFSVRARMLHRTCL